MHARQDGRGSDHEMEPTRLLPDTPSSAPWVPLEVPPDFSRHKVYVGTAGYVFDDWAGIFYPPSGRRGKLVDSGAANRTLGDVQGSRDKLIFYQKYFSFLEINHTFYKEPVAQTFIDIERRSKPGMLYAVKVHQDISHRNHFDAARGGEMMRRHAEAVAPLVETGRFHSFLIQLDERLAKSQKTLDYFMRVAAEAVRLRLSVHIEFRHRTWHHEYVLQTLKDGGVGICNTETAPVAEMFPLKAYATTDKGYVRYSGLNAGGQPAGGEARSPLEKRAAREARYDYLYSESEMVERIKKQLALREKTESLAVVFKNHARAGSVLNAMLNLKLLREKLEAPH